MQGRVGGAVSPTPPPCAVSSPAALLLDMEETVS